MSRLLSWGELLGLPVLRPRDQKSLTGIVTVPVSVRFRAQECTWEGRSGALWHVRETGLNIVQELGELDAWQVRNEFLHAVPDEPSMLTFLNWSGVFSRSSEGRGFWSVRRLQSVQKSLRTMGEYKPDMWKRKLRIDDSAVHEELFRYREFGVSLAWGKDAHALTLEVKSTLGALVAATIVDHLRGVEFRFCARAACGRQYEVTSMHRRKFCSVACAHAEAVRLSRERKRSSRFA